MIVRPIASFYHDTISEQPVGVGVLLTFLSTKVVRGGPRAIFNVVTCCMALFIVTRLLPRMLSDIAGFAVHHSLWGGDCAESDTARETPPGDGSIAGGLRIVVFGENDVATPVRTSDDNDDIASPLGWTENLCVELNCSQYISFIPHATKSSQSMLSNRLYAAFLDETTNKTALGSQPGLDYTHLPEEYPVAWELPDLTAQVDTFLSLAKPQNAPGDTLWVFSFGTWDVWALASMPFLVSRDMLDAMAEHLFQEVERLYQSSLDEHSVAWSNVSAAIDLYDRNDTKHNIGESTGDRSSSAGESSGAAAADSESSLHEGHTDAEDEDNSNNTLAEEPITRSAVFRILIPKLLDPTMTPGWRDLRPSSPSVHSRAEQMRCAAELTKYWNHELRRRLALWINGAQDPARVAEQSLTRAQQLVMGAAGAAAMAHYEKGLRNSALPTAGVLNGLVVDDAEIARQPKPKTQSQVERQRAWQKEVEDGLRRINNGESTADAPSYEDEDSMRAAASASAAADAARPTPTPAPRPPQPLRDGITYDMAAYVEAAIVDRQLRNAGLHDGNGIGAAPAADGLGFLVVADPCEMPVDDADNDDVDEEDAKPAELRVRHTDVAGEFGGRRVRVGVCDAPHEHLFETHFTLSSRAVAHIARQAAVLVRTNATMRAVWEGLTMPVKK